MEKACLIGMAFLPVVHASFAAVQQAEDRGDVAVDTRTAFGKPPRSLHLEPVESLSVPKNPDIPYRPAAQPIYPWSFPPFRR